MLTITGYELARVLYQHVSSRVSTSPQTVWYPMLTWKIGPKAIFCQAFVVCTFMHPSGPNVDWAWICRYWSGLRSSVNGENEHFPFCEALAMAARCDRTGLSTQCELDKGE